MTTAADGTLRRLEAEADAGASRSVRLQHLLIQGAKLNGSEARVMAALLGLRTATLKQLTEATGIHRTNIYPSLEALSAKGLCQRLSGKYAIWECPEPREVLARLQRGEEDRLQAELELASRALQEARTILDDPSGAADPPVSILDDARIAVMYVEAMATVEDEILVLNRGPYVGEMDAEADPLVLEALARGVSARALWVSDELIGPDRGVRDCADTYAQAGAEQRVVDALPLGMAILGHELALFMFPALSTSAAAAVPAVAAHHPAMVELGRAAFEYMWERATPYHPSALEETASTSHPAGRGETK